jgi:hypothetical protein
MTLSDEKACLRRSAPTGARLPLSTFRRLALLVARDKPGWLKIFSNTGMINSVSEPTANRNFPGFLFRACEGFV